ncbi:UPF0547 protein C16orf87-like [Holothuria leucospilota]|uniref:UPF0547 protein C16orf87-like n=1 Tax=Holothuria leucospilota TaxID=206669 RepID=A0A9Q1HDM8_HOLLE|nr:UPF0547 protein C16orf87-like [Holothuria leucospilota]
MVYKSCPACKTSVPVATKYCACGHVFFAKRLYHPKPAHQVQGDLRGGLSIRRTGRVSRGRPAYYSASEFENPFRTFTSSNRSERAAKVSNTRSKSTGDKETASPRKKKRKPGRPKGMGKGKVNKDKEKTEKAEPDEFDIYRNNSAEKQYIFAVTLAEINRKLGNEWNGPRTNGPKLNGPEEATSSTVSR